VGRTGEPVGEAVEDNDPLCGVGVTVGSGGDGVVEKEGEPVGVLLGRGEDVDENVGGAKDRETLGEAEPVGEGKEVGVF
jgi:hypothetical protein